MLAAEYIQQSQKLVEFHLKTSRYYVLLWKEFPWLVQFIDAAPLDITICTPIIDSGTFGFCEIENTVYFINPDNGGMSFDEVKLKIFEPFLNVIANSGSRYLEVMCAGKLDGGDDFTQAPIIDIEKFKDLSKGFKWNLKGLCKAFDDALKVVVANG